jgi:hypothetical protein
MTIVFKLFKNAVCDINLEDWKFLSGILDSELRLQLVTSVSKTILSVFCCVLHLDTF